MPTLRGRTVVNVFFESSTRTSSQLRAGRQAPVGRHHVAEGLGVVGRQGRVAQGHHPDDLRLRPRRGRDPPRRHRCAGPRHALHVGPRGQRRRRQAPAPHAVPARPLHDARGAGPAGRAADRDRRRRAALAGRAVEHPGLRDDGRRRAAGRPADADPARHRGDRRARLARHRRHRRRRRRLRAAHAARADAGGRQLRAHAARVHGALGRHPRPRAPEPVRHAPGADEPRRRDRRATWPTRPSR